MGQRNAPHSLSRLAEPQKPNPMSYMRFKCEVKCLLVLVIAMTGLQACHDKSARRAESDAQASALTRSVYNAPCGLDASTNTDPNNCGLCGVVCGTFVGNGRGYSFSQGTCSAGHCSPGNPPQLIQTPGTDCPDNWGDGFVVNTTVCHDFTVTCPCVNITNDSNNCGAVGNVCPAGLVCTFAQCH